jgi:hypothetical protein
MESSDIARAAAEMIRLHGLMAETVAGDALDRALEQGDVRGVSDWTQVAIMLAGTLRRAASREMPKAIPDFSPKKRAA